MIATTMFVVMAHASSSPRGVKRELSSTTELDFPSADDGYFGACKRILSGTLELDDDAVARALHDA